METEINMCSLARIKTHRSAVDCLRVHLILGLVHDSGCISLIGHEKLRSCILAECIVELRLFAEVTSDRLIPWKTKQILNV